LKSSAELNTYNLELQQKQEVSRLKSAIAGGTVDIYPYMVIYAYAAGLNYSPRPVPQSYQPYDLFLDSVNSLKYESDSRAPGYLLFANAAIDERYPFADESVTKRAMLQYYRATDTFKLTDFVDRDDTALVILFKRREFPLKMNLISSIEKRAALNEWIAPDTSSAVQYLYANIDFSYAGDLRRILFQSPRLKMRVRFEDGSEKDYSAIVPILKTGIVFNKQVNTTADAWTFFSTNGEGCKKVKAAKFYADNPAMFKKDFTITLKTFQVTD
jgi:hypothetical protein